MNIFLLAGDLPYDQHTVRAANRVLHSLISQFSRKGHHVTLQVIFPTEDRRPWTDKERACVGELATRDVDILPPVFRSDYAGPAGKSIGRMASSVGLRLFKAIEYFYPAVRLRPIIEQRMKESSADIAFIFWNPEGLAATYKSHCVPKISYYGMPDHAAPLARAEDSVLFGVKRTSLELAILKWNLKILERCHLRLMMDCDIVTNLSAGHANYYACEGHPRSLYVPNIWPEALSSVAGDRVPQPKDGKAKIFGSVGRPAATGNTYGLKYIGEEIVPRLDTVLGSDNYEIHIFGEGEPVPAVSKLLQGPSVKMRGWVDDIDSEICSSHIFLMANNTGRYRGSHTRFLHAWSLKACCVAHRCNAGFNPEMVHMENVLLGDTPDEMVELIVQVLRNPDLRHQIGEGGWRTYKAYFSPEVVVDRLLVEMEFLLTQRGV